MEGDGMNTRRWWGLRPWSRHSLVLLIAGVSYVAIGLSFRSYSLSQVPKQQLVNLTLALRWLPLKTWGTIFIVFGGLVVISSRWPRETRLWGYIILTGLSSVWSGFYFASVIVYRSTVNNLAGGLTWGLFAFMWWAISGLLDPGVVIHDESGQHR